MIAKTHFTRIQPIKGPFWKLTELAWFPIKMNSRNKISNLTNEVSEKRIEMGQKNETHRHSEG